MFVNVLDGDLLEVVWPAFGEAVRIDREVFIEHYDDLWYPSSDDVVARQVGRDGALVITHEEQFTYFSTD